MAENTTCFPEVEFNEVIQDKIIKSIFDKLSSCANEQELKDNINLILQEKSQQGLIDLDSVRRTSDFQTQANLLLECSLIETSKLIDQNVQIDAAYVINGITKFICNPPTFDFPTINLSFKFSLKDLFIKLLFQFIDLLVQFLLQILQKIISIVLSICESNFEGLAQGYQNINSILSTSFQNSLSFKLAEVNSTLEPIFRMFGFNSDGTLIESPNFVSCESNIGAIKPLNKFLDDLSMMLTPFEICSLFEGRPSQQVLELIKELLTFEYPLLQTRLADDFIITNFFIHIGRFIPQSICQNIRETYNQEYPYNCNAGEYSEREQVKLAILTRNGHSEEQSRQLLNRERERYSNRFKELGSFISKLRSDPDKVFDSISSNIFCKNGKQGIANLSSLPVAVDLTNSVVNSFYNPLKSIHYNDSLNVQDIYFSKQTQRKKVTRFAEPDKPVYVGNIRYISGETVKFKQVQALGNPIYYTNREEFALMIEQYQPDEVITYQSTIEKKIYDYIKQHFDLIGDVISFGEGNTYYENYFGDFGENTYNISQITQVYNVIINNLDTIAKNIYNKTILGPDDTNVYNRSNNITEDELVQDIIPYVENLTGETIEGICYLFVEASFIYGSEESVERIFIPSPTDVNERLFKIRTDDGSREVGSFDLERTLQITLEQFFDELELIVDNPRYAWKDNNYVPVVKINVYNQTVTRRVETPPLQKIYTLRELNVEDDGYIDNRWLADINKINAANESESQPIGILEEVQLSNLSDYQSKNVGFVYNDNFVSNEKLNFQSLKNNNLIDVTKPQDNSVLTLNQVVRNKSNSLSEEQLQQFNNLLRTEYGINNVEQLNNKSIVYTTSMFTNGPFRNIETSISNQLKELIPNPLENKSLQIQAFEKITNLTQKDYYEIFNNLLLRISLFSTIVPQDPNYQEIKNTILLIPFERIIGINKVKNDAVKNYLNDPCAISEDILKPNEITLFNEYLVESVIKLLVRTFCLKNDLKDLLSLSKINPYNFVTNDDSYIEFLLQTFKQDLKRLSGNDYFYNQVIFYIEKSIDNIIETQGILVDPISNQPISLDDTLSTDFKIRFFIKQEYSNILIRLENIFVNRDTQRQVNFNSIKNIMRETIQTTVQIPNEYDNLFFEYIFPVSKICSIIKINNIISMTENYDASNDLYNTTLETLKSMILNFINTDPLAKDCNSNNPTYNLDVPKINEEMIRQFIIRTPILIIKALAENYDPNIRIANPIRKLAESATGNNLPCLPFSLALLPIGTVPFGFGPPILPPWGFSYLALDTAEYLLTPQDKNTRLKLAIQSGKFDKLEDLFEKDSDC